jgi:hypothetical protein
MSSSRYTTATTHVLVVSDIALSLLPLQKSAIGKSKENCSQFPCEKG